MTPLPGWFCAACRLASLAPPLGENTVNVAPPEKCPDSLPIAVVAEPSSGAGAPAIAFQVPWSVTWTL
jgi:hypothetical protein